MCSNASFRKALKNCSVLFEKADRKYCSAFFRPVLNNDPRAEQLFSAFRGGLARSRRGKIYSEACKKRVNSSTRTCRQYGPSAHNRRSID